MSTSRIATNVPGSTRAIQFRTPRLGPDTPVVWEITGTNDSGVIAKNALVNTTKDAAIRFAISILNELAPDRLKRIRMSDYPVGTFLRNTGTGELCEVVEWDDRFSEWRKDDDGSTTSAIRLDGSPIVPWDDGTDAKFRWEPVQVKVETKTSWEVVE